MKQVNRFIKGMDSDTSPDLIGSDVVREAINMHFLSEGEHGAVQPLRSTVNEDVVAGLGFQVHGWCRTWGSFGGQRINGVLALVSDDIESKAVFIDVEGKVSHDVATLNLNRDEKIDAINFSDVDGDYVYIVHNNAYQFIKVSDAGEISNAIPNSPLSPLRLGNITYDGALLGGAYWFAYRGFNTVSCRTSGWSTFEGPFKIPGQEVGTPTNQGIRLTVNALDPLYDAYQILVVEHVDGLTGRRSTGKLLSITKDFHTNGDFTYRGNENGVSIDLSEIVVDGLPVIGARSLSMVKDRMFLSDVNMRQYNDIDVQITGASHNVSAEPEGIYASTIEASTKVQYYRNEEYAFGIRLIDEKGFSVVQPLDLSQFSDHQDWTWKFPERSNPDYTILDGAGLLRLIGLKIEGITNLPDWCVAFEIVRSRRIKDIISQIPHIPTIGVQGNYDRKQSYFETGLRNYTKQFDTIQPKVYKWGSAKNVSNEELEPGSGYTIPILGITLNDQPYGSWIVTQENDVDGSEICPAALAMRPEYVYRGVSDAPYSADDLTGTYLDIVDAVALRRDQRVEKLGTPGDPYDQNPENTVFADIYEASDRLQYYYRSNGSVDLDAIITNPYFNKRSRIDNSVDLAKDHNQVTLPIKPFSGDHFGEIELYGALRELVLQQREDNSVPGFWDRYFNPSYSGENSQLLILENRLLDFTKVMHEMQLASVNLFPGLAWTALPSWISNTQATTVAGQVVNLLGTENATPTGDIAGGAYIANIVKGQGPGRYGQIDESREWIGTGSVIEVDGSASYDVDVWGGDCYLTKHAFRVSNSVPQPFVFDNISAEMNDIDGSGTATQPFSRKLGAPEHGVEIIELFLESEINADMMFSQGYPLKSGDDVNVYSEDMRLLYNFGLSVEDEVKVFFGVNDRCPQNDPNLIIHSDINVRGSVSNEFADTRGFDKFKANNVYSVPAELGRVVKLETLEDRYLYVFQDRGVYVIPIGQAEVSFQDGASLAAGTAEVFGTGAQYIQRERGAQDIHHVINRNNSIWGLDYERAIAFKMSRSGWSDISRDKSNEKHLRDLINGEVRVGWDCRYDRFVVHTLNGAGLVFDSRGNFWDHKLDFPAFQLYDGALDDSIILSQGNLYSIDSGGFTNEYLGESRPSILRYIVNNQPDLNKVCSVIKLAIKDGSQVSVVVTTEDQVSISKTLNERNNSWFQNLFRDSNSAKIKGRYFIVELTITGGEARLTNSVTENRIVR